jgi:hypothetical protein
LPQNSESWRINRICQKSEETFWIYRRASNEWRLISRRSAGRGPARYNKAANGPSKPLRQTVAPGTDKSRSYFVNQKQYWEPLGDNLKWENPRRTLRDPTAIIIETWLGRYGNSLINSLLRTLGRSYLILPCGTSERPTAQTREVALVPTKIIIRPGPDRAA